MFGRGVNSTGEIDSLFRMAGCVGAQPRLHTAVPVIYLCLFAPCRPYCMLPHNAAACSLRTISPRTHFWQARHWGLSVEGANRKLERERGMPHFPSFWQCLQKWRHSWIPSLWHSQHPFRHAQRQERSAILRYCNISSSFPVRLLLPGHLLPGSLPLLMSRAATFPHPISADVTVWCSISNAFSLKILAWYSVLYSFLPSFISSSPVFVCFKRFSPWHPGWPRTHCLVKQGWS